MKFFEASLETIYWRFILLMTVVIAPFFMGVPLLALLALPIFLSCMLGVSFRKPQSNHAGAKSKKLEEKGQMKQVA